MGSHDEVAAPSQQPALEQQSAGSPAPVRARRGFAVLLLDDFLNISAHLRLLLAAEDFFRLDSLVPRATLGVQKTEKLLQSFRIGRIPEVGAFAPDTHQVLVL